MPVVVWCVYSQQVEHIKSVPKIVRNREFFFHQIIQIPIKFFLSHYETVKGSVTVFALHLNCRAKANKTHEKDRNERTMKRD